MKKKIFLLFLILSLAFGVSCAKDSPKKPDQQQSGGDGWTGDVLLP